MPASCCKPDYDAIFDDRTARRQLKAYRRSGAGGSTRRLIEAIKDAGIEGVSVLDIGGGVGIIGLELLRAGAESLTGVDASRPYVSVAAEEVTRRGWDDRASFHFGDFVELAEGIDAADVVTLDRVICCYGDWRGLVDASVSRSRRLYGVVYPNERWWLRAGIGCGNLMLRLFRQSFRGYVHPEGEIDERIRAAGFTRRSHHRGWIWQTSLYERNLASADA